MTELPVLALNIAFRLLAKKTKTKNSQQKLCFKVAFKIWLLELSAIMLSVVMLSVIMLIVIMLSAIMLSVVMLSDDMLRVKMLSLIVSLC
jgi:hypothetical protein